MLLIDHTELTPGGTAIVTPRGPLTSATAPALENAIDTLAQEASPFVIIDASGLEYASSAGIGMILHVHRAIASRHGALVVCCLPAEIHSLFRLIGFDRAIDIADSIDEAESVIAEHRAGKTSASSLRPNTDPRRRYRRPGSAPKRSAGMTIPRSRPGTVSTGRWSSSAPNAAGSYA